AWRDRGLVKEMVDRAAAARYEALVLTVDTAVLGRRERDVRRGFSLPPTIGPATLLAGASPVTLSDYINTQFDPALSWSDIDWLRSVWDGPLVLKGVQTVDDAVRGGGGGGDA